MFIVESYGLAVALCWVTMFAGDHGEILKIVGQTWRYELFYWDYVIGILLFSWFGVDTGSTGEGTRIYAGLAASGMENFGALSGWRHIQCSNILLSASCRWLVCRLLFR